MQITIKNERGGEGSLVVMGWLTAGSGDDLWGDGGLSQRGGGVSPREEEQTVGWTRQVVDGTG